MSPTMARAVQTITKILLLFSASHATARPVSDAQQRDETPAVDLGYASYTGYHDATLDLDYFKGIRYAAPPTGQNRWMKPQTPPKSDAPIALNENWPPICPQAPPGGGGGFTIQNEDCLYLSVIAPPGAKDLPVLVWIHGGGYGGGSGSDDFAEMLINNERGFIVVPIQYRLGAFGFLSSAEVGQHGTPNVGLWDQEFALQWVQDHIASFGGDATKVTVAGSSAGGGSVMTLAMAHGGTSGTSLFQNAITGSPFLPQQWPHDGPAPTAGYNALATKVGCLAPGQDSPGDGSVLSCLRGVDSATLQQANFDVTVAGPYGMWTFLPVTDGKYLVDRPSAQLLDGQVNGARILSTNNAAEGRGFVPETILTDDDFMAYIASLLPLMSAQDIQNVGATYAIDPVVPNAPLFATKGDEGPTAMNQSSLATGHQQRAFNLYAETTFVCPSYWLASAFARQTGNAWHYQLSVPPAVHGLDLNGLLRDGYVVSPGLMSVSFRLAMQKIWGQFIMHNDPTLPEDIVAAITAAGDNLDGAKSSMWPKWDTSSYAMLNMNMTFPAQDQPAVFSIANGYTWEANRGKRCDAWASVGSIVPE